MPKKNLVLNEFKKSNPAKILRVQARKVVSVAFEKKKQEMIKAFLEHPITKEINEGPQAENISRTLGGKGNLFTFIGFDDFDEPIQPIVDLLESTSIKISSSFGDRITFSILLPTSRDIFAATPMPWAPGRSWAKGIESGISGLGFFLALSKASNKSRSGFGLQSQKKIKASVKFRNTEYISSFLKKYEKEFKNIKIK
jgi:hypothetical protein